MSDDCNVVPLLARAFPSERRADSLKRQIIEHLGELESLAQAHQGMTEGHEHSTLSSSRFAETLLLERRDRESVFPPDMLGDPVWDMALDLFVAEANGKSVSVTSLCYASGVPATTALRWLSLLVEKGMVARHNDPRDGRRSYVSLERTTRDDIHRYLERCAKRRGITLTT